MKYQSVNTEIGPFISGVNFFLYCVSGKKFRNDVKDILCCCRGRGGKGGGGGGNDYIGGVSKSKTSLSATESSAVTQ